MSLKIIISMNHSHFYEPRRQNLILMFKLFQAEIGTMSNKAPNYYAVRLSVTTFEYKVYTLKSYLSVWGVICKAEF